MMLKNMNTWSKNLLYIMVIFAVPKLVIRHNFAELLFYLAIALVAVIMSVAPNWGGAVISAVLFGVLTEVFDWVSYANWYWPSFLTYLAIGGVLATVLAWRQRRETNFTN
ncbi:hypothetical protein [Weissella cibaria]|uniref:hypothetical protein n=3 Tax=Weissella cibaria TaxID=137591 RepID=UPI0011977D08|nr:hypothetical protein [Weissella cibaria]MCB5859170.1 hypothetical protein [Weissella cibaria]MCB5868757.1 hypothetical protein [Weissella cibaria]MCB5878540.1 hypothetical protein [Weissella cibaria]MCB6903145.1 hypothetical protein [Weissella cibaria]TVV29708.1 hypothetical protein FOZ71_06125 [Weissella cibaria]